MLFATACLLAGLATIWLPIPTGIPLLAVGGFLVVANSRPGRNVVRRLRLRINWFDRAIIWLENRTGPTFGRVLKTTRPLITRHREKAINRSPHRDDPEETKN